MEREIKFRAWKNHEMIQPCYAEVYRDGSYSAGTNYLNSTESIIMQYTGLKDKNGIEIYEGDIVNAYYEIQGTEDGKEFFGTGKWNHEYFEIIEFKDGAFWSGSLMKGKIHEVIGNIYENPELLTN